MKGEGATPAKDTQALREAVIEACRSFSGLGYFIGTWGNISVRVEEGVLVTPSRVEYLLMAPDDLVVVSWEGRRIRGHRLPSSETELHRVLLLRRPDLGAFVHSHSPYASSIACAQRSLPVCVEEMSQIIGGEVRCARYVPAGRHRELAEAACEAMGNETTAVLLANHGVVVGGRDLAEASVAARVVEKAAMIFVSAMALGGCATIAAEMVAEERHRFLYKYGKEDDTATQGGL